VVTPFPVRAACHFITSLDCEFLPETVPHGRKHKIPFPPKAQGAGPSVFLLASGPVPGAGEITRLAMVQAEQTEGNRT
jgi:hypothetical protein